MKNLRKNKKGFTLIEVIVVLVILAIIIALAVPSVMKYVDDANDAKYEAQARAVYIAADAELAKDYAEDGDIDAIDATKLTALITNVIGADEVNVAAVTAYTDAAASVPIAATTKPNQIKAYKMEIDGKKVVTIVRNGKVTITNK